jgi:hypothetical protein
VANGRELHFYLAGINNQNFLMRDRETGSWWQQVTGRAISGTLAGSTLELVPNDELTFDLWKSESPRGLVLAPVARHEKDYEEGWEKEVAKAPVPMTFPGQGVADRDVVLGISLEGQQRAFPLLKVKGPNPVEDHVGGVPVVLVTGPDGESVRMFRSQLNGNDIELYRESKGEITGNTDWHLIDSQGNSWNFAGCATSGPAKRQCLEKIHYLKDYWFDWKNYNPRTTVYSR